MNAERDDHATPLHLATIDGHFEVVMTLLGHNASVNSRDSGGRAPLQSFGEWVCQRDAVVAGAWRRREHMG